MINPEDIREIEAAFADLEKIRESGEFDSAFASGSGMSISEGLSNQSDPIVEVLADILSELQSLNEFIRQ